MPNAKDQTEARRALPSDSRFASKAAHALALKHQDHVPLEDLKGSGSRGKITLSDVRVALSEFTRLRAREAGSSLAEAVKEGIAYQGLMPEWAPLFIAVLIKDPNVSRAAAAAGISRRLAYRVKEEIPIFKDLWLEAVEISTDILETEARRRAKDGVEEPVYQGSRLVGHKTVYSDQLMMLLLRAHRPERFAERNIVEGKFKHEHQGRVVQPSDEGERRLEALVERLSCHLGLPPSGSEGAQG